MRLKLSILTILHHHHLIPYSHLLDLPNSSSQINQQLASKGEDA
jgi:hypothetical protein